MKKILIAVLSLMCLVLVGCGAEPTTTTTKQTSTTVAVKLETPQNLAIVKGVVTFDSVEGADSYSLKIMRNEILSLSM